MKITVAELAATNGSEHYSDFHVVGLYNNESFQKLCDNAKISVAVTARNAMRPSMWVPNFFSRHNTSFINVGVFYHDDGSTTFHIPKCMKSQSIRLQDESSSL